MKHKKNNKTIQIGQFITEVIKDASSDLMNGKSVTDTLLSTVKGKVLDMIKEKVPQNLANAAQNALELKDAIKNKDLAKIAKLSGDLKENYDKEKDSGEAAGLFSKLTQSADPEKQSDALDEITEKINSKLSVKLPEDMKDVLAAVEEMDEYKAILSADKSTGSR